MKTYFIRHSKSCGIGNEIREKLWNEKLIAIHYEDKSSTVPTDYSGKRAQSAMRCLNEISDHGGYVCATLWRAKSGNGCFVGRVKAGTTVLPHTGPYLWNSPHPAVAKTLALEVSLELSGSDANRLLIGMPRQGTIVQWKGIGDRVERFVRDGKLTLTGLSDLLPYEQETMCAEFLRLETAAAFGLPRLEFLSAPVGSTRAAIDIAGVASSGVPILCQVTHHHRFAPEVISKTESLKTASEGSSPHLIFFCRCDAQMQAEGVTYFPMEEVFRVMKTLRGWKKSLGIT